MKTKLLVAVMMMTSAVAFAQRPGRGGGDPAAREERREERFEQARLMYVVAISEALELKEAPSSPASRRRSPTSTAAGWRSSP